MEKCPIAKGFKTRVQACARANLTKPLLMGGGGVNEIWAYTLRLQLRLPEMAIAIPSEVLHDCKVIRIDCAWLTNCLPSSRLGPTRGASCKDVLQSVLRPIVHSLDKGDLLLFGPVSCRQTRPSLKSSVSLFTRNILLAHWSGETCLRTCLSAYCHRKPTFRIPSSIKNLFKSDLHFPLLHGQAEFVVSWVSWAPVPILEKFQ